MRSARASLSIGLSLCGLAAVVNCGSAASPDATNTPSGTGGLASGGTNGAGAGAGATSKGGSAAAAGVGNAGASGSAATCSTACAAGEKCSGIGTCIPTDGCATPTDCASGTICDAATKKCVPGGGCGAQKISADALPSNLIIALDRSCSMTQKLASGKTKWEVAVGAIGQMTTQFATKIRFGLSMFPTKTGDKCAAAGPLAAPIGDAAGAKIAALLQASLVSTDPNFPNAPCTTPIDTGVLTAGTDPALTDGIHQSFALLMTDGEQSAGCMTAGGAAGVVTEIAALAKKGIPTFVVGFGGQVNAMEHDSFATAGGKPASPTTPKYYSAEDEPSLAKALAAIAGQAIGCSFSLGTKPPDPTMLYTFFDKKDVPHDATHMAGWDYDAAKNQVTVYGSYCDQLKAGTVKVVDIVFGCDMAPPG